MSGQRGHHPSDCYAKAWDPEFSEDRNFKEDKSYVECKMGINADGDDFGIFLRDSEDSVPSSKVGEVEEFVRGACLDDLKSGAGTAGQRRGAWLDDRSTPCSTTTRCVREYERRLTATTLYRLLKLPRYGLPDTPDANRRLIYIQNLDPYYILALAQTSSFHQVTVLRDAIWKHLALQTSIRVKIPHIGYPIFQLELHIPYLALRPGPPKVPSLKKVNRNPPRQWTDLSFLAIESSKLQDQGVYGIHEAQISVVICGSDNRRWVGYGFVDKKFDDEDMGDAQEEGILDDPIASDYGRIDANLPLWDPREYFLSIFEIRIDQVLKEWEFLVRTVERSIKRYRTQHSFTLSPQPGKEGDQAEDIKKSFDWTHQTMDLLSQLLDVLSETIKAWEIFNSPSGDINYFSDIYSSQDAQQPRTRLSLRAIKETMETMEGLQQKLFLLDKSCRNSAEALQLRLTVENNEAVQRNGVTTEFTVSIISPVALAIAFYSMPQAAVPVKLDPKYFTVVILFIMVLVKLLFVILCAMPRRPWWWKKVVAWIKKLRFDEVGPIWLALRRGHNYPDNTIDIRTTEDMEMTLGV
ncbi:hypothetical protein B0O99DRAFT_693577 [Bisporella sp. PMI_857]|nr:hypothetical protein B0O99DRAFT_693577 [Bisporella sp. PMI_857]